MNLLKYLPFVSFVSLFFFYTLVPKSAMAMETENIHSHGATQTVLSASGGSSDGSLGGSSDDSSGDFSDGSLGGSSDDSSGGSSDGSLGGSSDGSLSGSSDASSGGSSDGSSGGSSDGSSGGSSDGSLGGSSDGSSGGSSDGSLGGSSDGSLGGSSDGSLGGSSDDSSGDSSDGSLGGSSDGSSDDSDLSTQIPQYTVQLSQDDIPQAGCLAFTTIHYSFANRPTPPNMYPGRLTIEITEPIFIPSGVSLDIGTLSIGGNEERPVIKGQFSDTPLITLAEGASLTLRCVDFDISGNGMFLKQEDGVSFDCIDTTIPEEWLEDSTPIVNHQNQAPDDIWLLEGTILESGMLPTSLYTYVQQNGTETLQEIAIQWDLQPYDGRTTGEITLSGTFLDENGNVLASLLPLEITIHWYQPDNLSVQEVTWKGNDLSLVQFTLPYLPETVCEIWGEVSEDNQKTWVSVPLELQQNDKYGIVCAFQVPSDTAYDCRLAAIDIYGKRLYSESVRRTEDGDDTEGNRGGATTPNTPDREPTFPSEVPPEIPIDSESAAENAEQTESENSIQNPSLPAIAVHLKTIAKTPTAQNQISVPSDVAQYRTTQTQIDTLDTNTQNQTTLAEADTTIPTQTPAQAPVQTPIQAPMQAPVQTNAVSDFSETTNNTQQDTTDTTNTTNTQSALSVTQTKPPAWKQGIFIIGGILVCGGLAFVWTQRHTFGKWNKSKKSK